MRVYSVQELEELALQVEELQKKLAQKTHEIQVLAVLQRKRNGTDSKKEITKKSRTQQIT